MIVFIIVFFIVVLSYFCLFCSCGFWEDVLYKTQSIHNVLYSNIILVKLKSTPFQCMTYMHNTICFLISTLISMLYLVWVNTMRPRQNGRRFADDTFKCISLNENVRISIKISLKFVPKGPINNNLALVQIMARLWSGDKPLSEPMMVSLLTYICITPTRPQWVNV